MTEVKKIVVDPGARYEFQVEGSDRVWSLPSLDDLPIGVKMSLAKSASQISDAHKNGVQPSGEALQEFGEAQLKLLDRYCPGLTDEVSEKALALILSGWQEASGITVGESQASAS